MVRLPASVRRELERVAELHQRSLSAEIIYRLEQSLPGGDPKGPKRSVPERLAAIEKDLQTFWRTLQAQQKVMQERDERAAPPRRELQQLREELQKINSVMNDMRNDYVHLEDRLREPQRNIPSLLHQITKPEDDK